MKLFAEKRIENLFKETEEKIKTVMSSTFKSDLLTKDMNTLANEIYPLVKVPILLELDKEKTDVKVKMKKVSVDKLSYDIRMFANQRYYDLACVTYYVPYKGNKNLFNYQPKQHSNFSFETNIVDNVLNLEFQTSYQNEKLNEVTEKDVTRAFKTIIEKIEENIEQLKTECNQFNETLKSKIIEEIEKYRIENTDREGRESRLNPFK